jgi:hypothetical protein
VCALLRTLQEQAAIWSLGLITRCLEEKNHLKADGQQVLLPAPRRLLWLTVILCVRT